MKKIIVAMLFLPVVTLGLLMKPAGVTAQPNRSDLEGRVNRLEAEATISRQHIQDLERRVGALESNAGQSADGKDLSDLEASVRWIRQVYIPSSDADFDKLDKRVKDLERYHLLEYVCAKPTAK